MADVVFVAVTLAFFVLALGLVRACERIIGRDEPSIVAVAPLEAEPGEEVAA